MAVYEIETADGAVYEVETADSTSPTRTPMGASSSWEDEPESSSSSFPEKLVNASQWLTNPIGKIGDTLKEAPEKLVGAATRFLPFGDEVIAGGSAAIDTIDPFMEDTSFSDAYNQRIGQVRGYQKKFDTENPVTSALVSGAGALAMPLGSWTSGAKTLKGAIGRSIPEGFAYGSAFGFGEGEGDFKNRASNALEKGITGAIVSPFATAATRGAAKLFEKAPSALNDLGRRQELQAFGATQKNINETIDRMPDITEETGFINPLSQAVESFKSKGGGRSGMTGEALLQDLNTQRQAYREQVDEMLNIASKAQNFKIIPKFKYVQDYLKNVGSQQKDEAIKIAEEMIGKTLKATKSGKIKAFHNEKVDLGRMIKDRAWGQDEMSNIKTDIAKRLYGDLRRITEESFELFTGQNRKVLTNLNKELGYRESLEPLFKNILKSGEARSPIKSAFNLLKTSGGLGQTLIAGAAGGTLGPVGMGLGAIGGLYAQTPSGQRDVAKLFRGAGNKLGFLPEAASTVRDFPFSKVFSSMQRDDIPEELQLPPEVTVEEYGFSPEFIIQEEPQPDMKLPAQTDIDPSSITNSKYKVDSALKEAVIGQESAGDPKAESKENAFMKVNKTGTAKGLMQLIDSTGKQMFEKYRDKLPKEANPEKYDPYNAIQNEILGTSYLEEMLEEFDGDLELALTAYHSGPGTVKNLLRKTKGETLSDILPYLGKDGKQYASRIISNYKKKLVEA